MDLVPSFAERSGRFADPTGSSGNGKTPPLSDPLMMVESTDPQRERVSLFTVYAILATATRLFESRGGTCPTDVVIPVRMDLFQVSPLRTVLPVTDSFGVSFFFESSCGNSTV